MCEQLILQGYSMCIIDPEGDYQTLDRLPGVVTLGGDDPVPRPRDLDTRPPAPRRERDRRSVTDAAPSPR